MNIGSISINKDQYNNKKEYIRLYQKEYVKKRRCEFMLNMGTCYFCGSDTNLEMHHVDPNKKESHNIFSWTDERIKNELDKCVVLCRDCHIKYHSLNRLLPQVHGEVYSYKRYGCRCELCTKANTENKRKYKPRYSPA
jgi:hypothetical protein